jgi:hypothetical protein
MATEIYKKNVISQILDDSGRMVSDHSEKSALFYKNSRRGTVPLWAFLCSLIFRLSSPPPPHNSLDHLCLPFSKEEIDEVVCDCPMTRPRGLMDLTPLFSKRHGPSLELTCTDFVKNSSIIELILRVLTTLT